MTSRGPIAVLAATIVMLNMFGCSKQVRPESPPIKVIAKKWAFEPREIHVKANQDVWLEVSTPDEQHSFECEELGISESIQPGKPALFHFKAEKRGTYKVKCGILCGRGHDDMIGEIIVE